MAGGSDLPSSKSAKNSATCKRRQGADIKKKKQSCDTKEISPKEKINDDDNSGKNKEVDKDSKVAMKEKEDGNSNIGAVIKKEEVMKKNDDKLNEVSVNKSKEDCNIKGAVSINEGEKCNNVNYDKSILNKNDVYKRKDALSKETDLFVKGVAGVGENKKCSNYKDTNKKAEDGLQNEKVQSNRFDGNDVNKKEMIEESKSEHIDNVNIGNEIMGTTITKDKEKDICYNNNNIETLKKENEVKSVSVKEDAKTAKESTAKNDCITRGGNDSVSNGDKDLPSKSSSKKRQFGYNNRGRGSYGNNRGRNFNWRGGWGYNNYNRYQNRRMMNFRPSSAFRGNDQPRSNFSESARGNSKMSSPFHAEVPPQGFIGSLQPVYFDSQINYQDCYYFPQVWPPQQIISDDRATTYYQERSDISGAHANIGETEAAAYKPYAGDVSLSNAMEAIEVSKENVKADHKPPGNQELEQTDTNNQIAAEANQVQEGQGMATNIIASVSSNPLFELGKSVEHDKLLVQTFAGIEMRPSTQLPPDYGLQWYFIPYGAALPPSVIPVMVVPFINAPDSTGSMYQARQDGNGGHDQGFPPPQSLLPSYFNNMDLPGGPLQTPSPVDTYQPAGHTWPNQVMAPVTAGNPAQYVWPQVHSSQTEILTEDKFKAK